MLSWGLQSKVLDLVSGFEFFNSEFFLFNLEKLQITCLSNSNVQELMRCIRSQAESLIGGLPKQEMMAMALGLAHSLSRYKLKFSPDKIDTMIVQVSVILFGGCLVWC